MSLQDLGSIGEFIGAIAVVISLLYVAHQIRQSSHQLELNSKHIQASMYHATNDAFYGWFRTLAESAESSSIWRRGAAGESLAPEERLRFDALVGMLFLSYENNFEQLRLGTVERDTLAISKPAIVALMKSPNVQQWWNGMGAASLSPEFRSAIEALIREPSES